MFGSNKSNSDISVSVNCSDSKNRDYPWEMYTLKELLRATNNFHQDNKIGEGGFGSVYWGRTSKGIEANNYIHIMYTIHCVHIYNILLS